MLFLMKKRLPNKVIAHGWVLSSGSKMSKSKGNVISPLDLLRKYESDVLRAYLCSKITLYQNGVLNEELLAGFYQDFFVKKLGNLLARTSRMLELYSQGIVPAFRSLTTPFLTNYFAECSRLVTRYREEMNLYSVTVAFASIQDLLALTNKFVSEVSPWKISAEGNYQLLEEVLNTLVNGIKILGFLLVPFTPALARKIMLKFGISYYELNFSNLLDFASISGRKVEQTPIYFT